MRSSGVVVQEVCTHDGPKLGKLGFACGLVRVAQGFDMVEKFIHGDVDTVLHRHNSMYLDQTS